MFGSLERAKNKRQKKIIQKLEKTIEKQLYAKCTNQATELVQKYLLELDRKPFQKILESVDPEVSSLVNKQKLKIGIPRKRKLVAVKKADRPGSPLASEEKIQILPSMASQNDRPIDPQSQLPSEK